MYKYTYLKDLFTGMRFNKAFNISSLKKIKSISREPLLSYKDKLFKAKSRDFCGW